jgi:hypothetical protein
MSLYVQKKLNLKLRSGLKECKCGIVGSEGCFDFWWQNRPNGKVFQQDYP